MKKSFLKMSAFCAGLAIVASVTFSCSKETDENLQVNELKATYTADGFAAGTTGGAGGTSTTVTTASAFTTAATSSSAMIITVSGSLNVGQVKVKSNKTIVGANASATLTGNLALGGVSNIIIANLNITNPSGVGTADGIEVSTNCTKIFITHCTFNNCNDGEVDIKRQSTNVTVSWCRFRYTSQTSHCFVNLIGHSDSYTSDRGYLHVTMHHNWYDAGCVERMPRVRYGTVHVYNNYYGSSVSNYCVGLGNESQVLLQNCYFDSQSTAWKDYSSSSSTMGKIHWAGLYMVSTSVPTWAPNSTVFTPSYSYTLDAASGVKASVTAGA